MDLRRPGPRHRRRHRAGPVAEHPHRPGRREPVGGGRLGRADPTKPGPWVTWQETRPRQATARTRSSSSGRSGPGTANCDGVTPARRPTSRPRPGDRRLLLAADRHPARRSPALDPSLNVDPTRDGIEPDIAFTGANDMRAVGRLVRDRTRPGPAACSCNNEMVFAAKGVSDGVGRRRRLPLGRRRQRGQGVLDTSGTNGFGTCAASTATEQAVLAEQRPDADAEDPRVAAGTMNPANPTVPWVAWDETVGGVTAGLRLAAGGRGEPHFELVNGGAADLDRRGRLDAPGHHVLGQHAVRDLARGRRRRRHEGVRRPLRQRGQPDVRARRERRPADADAPQADVREPISSGCTANPFNADGAACQGGAVGNAVLPVHQRDDPRSLFADAYQPDTPVDRRGERRSAGRQRR